jgi:hypothetical protein
MALYDCLRKNLSTQPTTDQMTITTATMAMMDMMSTMDGSLLGDETAEEVANAARDVNDAGTDGPEYRSHGRRSVGSEEDEERDSSPGEDSLNHVGPFGWAVRGLRGTASRIWRPSASRVTNANHR